MVVVYEEKYSHKTLFSEKLVHARFLKIYANSELVTKMMHSDNQHLLLDEDIKALHLKLDYFRNTIPLPDDTSDIYIVIYMDIGKGIIQNYVKLSKKKCITADVVSKEEFDNFDATFYAKNQNWLSTAEIDKPTVYIGIMANIIALLYSVYWEDEWKNILFLLGAGGFVSLIIILLEKDKINLGDYKTRMWAMAISIVFMTIIIPTTGYPIKAIVGILALLFILRFIRENNRLKHLNKSGIQS